MGELPTGRDPPPDLLICDREPIHIPGRIQPNGMLLAVGDDGVVSHASENLNVPLCPTARAALGRPLAGVLGLEFASKYWRPPKSPRSTCRNPCLSARCQGAQSRPRS